MFSTGLGVLTDDIEGGESSQRMERDSIPHRGGRGTDWVMAGVLLATKVSFNAAENPSKA